MKKKAILLFLSTILFAVALFPSAGLAGVDINIGVSIPLPVVTFPAPPAVVIVPGTYVYAVPDGDIDIVFYQGYWYRPHKGYWYRAAHYNGPWKHFEKKRVPIALVNLPRDFRHIPPGHKPMPYGQVKQNWKKWEKEKYWDKREKHEKEIAKDKRKATKVEAKNREEFKKEKEKENKEPKENKHGNGNGKGKGKNKD